MERKLEIYKKALGLIERDLRTKGYYNLGLCFAIYQISTYPEQSPYYDLELYPEILEYKPKHVDDVGDYWWPKSDYKTRIEILKNTIDKLEKTNCF